jgi:hypothetical protein
MMGFRVDAIDVKDYQEHQNEIHTKLIAIMGDRLSAHIKTLQVRLRGLPTSHQTESEHTLPSGLLS